MRVCDGCSIKLPPYRRRNKVGEQMLCDGCTEGKPGSPGRPIGMHGSLSCQACAAPMGDAGLVRTGGLLRCADGCSKTAEKVRITKDYADPDGGYLLWKGETFDAMSWPPFDSGVEVKSAGSYLWVPSGYFTVDGKTATRKIAHDSGDGKRIYQNGNLPVDSPAIRKNAHDSGDGATIYHCPFCFTESTRYITQSGIRTFGDTVGTTQWVLSSDPNERTAGRWVQAHIHEFGEQPIMRVTLQRNKRTKVVEATPEHRWLVKSDKRVAGKQARSTDRDVVTSDLKAGQRLSYLRPDGVGALAPSDAGIRHGIVFGDGSAQGKQASVSLWGEKDKQLLRYFPDRRYKDINTADRVLGTGVPGVHVSGDLQAWMKALPESDNQGYLYGWLAGYFAADGTVSKQGQVIINSANLAHLEAVRDIALGLGITTYDITMKMRIGFVGREPSALYGLEFVSSTLNEDFFLTETHRDRWLLRGYDFERIGWTVVSVEQTDRVEKVYCAVVPDAHSFALEGNIWVGNCGAGQAVARSDGTTECGFCHACFTVQVQPEHTSMPQTDPNTGQPMNMPGMPGDPAGHQAPTPTPTQTNDGDFSPAGTGGPEGFAPAGQGPVEQFAPAGSGKAARKTAGAVHDKCGKSRTYPSQGRLYCATCQEFFDAKSKAAARFYSNGDTALSEESYIRHLALRFADDRSAVVSQIRTEHAHERATR